MKREVRITISEEDHRAIGIELFTIQDAIKDVSREQGDPLKKKRAAALAIISKSVDAAWKIFEKDDEDEDAS